MKWTPQKDTVIEKMFAEDATLADVAFRLKTTKQRVKERAHHIGLDFDMRDKESKKKERPCLKCKKVFLSDGPHNRLCDYCKKNNDEFLEVTCRCQV